jgi:6-phosphogluconolactonase
MPLFPGRPLPSRILSGLVHIAGGALLAALASCGGNGAPAALPADGMPAAPATYTIGGTISGLNGSGLVLQNNAGNDLAIAANGSFTFTTPVTSGLTYAVTVKTQPSALKQTCTVTGGSGTVSAAVTSVALACVTATPRFAYVANFGSANVSMYTIDAVTGTLTANGGAIAAGTNPAYVTVDPSGKFAYVANFSSNNVSMYTIDAVTGALTANGSIAA